MARSLDLSSLTRAEQLVLASGFLLALNGFIPWWYRVATATSTYTYNAGLTGLGVVVVATGAIAAIGVLGRTNIWPQPAPRADGMAYAVLGLVATVATLVEVSRSDAEWIGSYVALGLALVLTLAGFVRSRQRRAGWQ